MIRIKPENFTIAVGILLLYLVLPPLAHDIRQSVAQPLVKRQAHDLLSKFDPETDLPLATRYTVLSGPEREREIPVEARPIRLVGQPVFEATPRLLTFMPYLSKVGGELVAADPVPAPPPPADPEPPVRLVIPDIQLDAPIVPAKTRVVRIDGKKYRQWMVPNERVAAWHKNTARLGEAGNTVINGHHNVYGEVFGRLVDLEEGALIQIYSETRMYTYVVANKMLLPETYQELDVRMENAQWILASQDERVTLITCWPYETSTHRLIIVARPQ